MNELVDYIIEDSCDNIFKYNFPIGKPFGIITYVNNVKYEFLLHLKENSERLIVHSSGAIDAKLEHVRSRPFLHRWSWSGDFKDSVIYFNDPTLYIHEGITGGYGVGTKDDYYLEKIANFVKLFAKKLNVANEDILFYGSSAGGFTSFILSIMIRDSCAICDIPQFYVDVRWASYWNNFKKYIFTGMSDDEILSKYSDRINVFEKIKQENYIPNAMVILDCSDERDFNTQYKYFFEDISKLPFENNENDIKIIINGKNLGHAPLDKFETLHLIEKSKFIFNDIYYKKYTEDCDELAVLKTFKEDIVSTVNLFNQDNNNYLDSEYEKIYNDIMNDNVEGYLFNVVSFNKVKDSKFFDADYYISHYNIPISKKYALLHYLNQGFEEGKNPSAIFNGNKYLEIHEDVKKAGMNPLVHYELFGRKEGRALSLM